jgi:hypothetical protein
VVRVGVVAVSDSTGQQLAVGTLNARLAAMLGTLKSGLCRRPRDQQPQFPRRSPPKALGPAARVLELILDQRGADIADLPGGESGLLVRDYEGEESDRLVAHRPRRGLAGRRIHES